MIIEDLIKEDSVEKVFSEYRKYSGKELVSFVRKFSIACDDCKSDLQDRVLEANMVFARSVVACILAERGRDPDNLVDISLLTLDHDFGVKAETQEDGNMKLVVV